MDVLFKTEQLRQDCLDARKATRRWGALQAKRLRRRLDDLQAADSLAAMVHLPGNCHELKVDRAGQLAIDILGGLRLLLEPAIEPKPEKPDGGLDWTRVTAIRILGIEDYHD